MCSVLGCASERRGARRFRLPDDPERRLAWVQFLLEVNQQRLRESSWTDITVCGEHFTRDCFEPGTVQLKPDVVPTLCDKTEEPEPELEEPELGLEEPEPGLEEPEADGPVESPQCGDPVQTEHAPFCTEGLNASRTATTYSEVPVCTFTASQAGLESCHGPLLPDVLNTPNISTSDPMHEMVTTELNEEKVALLQRSGRFLANERGLLQLFRHRCPSCGCKLHMEKIAYESVVILNQRCLQCTYRFQWKRQVGADVPKAEDRGGSEGPQQGMATDFDPGIRVFCETVTFSDDEDGDSSEKGKEDDPGKDRSDSKQSQGKGLQPADALRKESEEEDEEEGNYGAPGGLRIKELCVECGRLFDVLEPHTCEHKSNPFSCDICGIRCSTEVSLQAHSKIHGEAHDLPCQFCHAIFKTRSDQQKHERRHRERKDPYQCPDCPEAFASSKGRSVHLAKHPKWVRCGVCAIEFKDLHHLRRHSVVHTGLKPYTCSVCRRGFNQASHLKSHTRLHTGERPFRCQHCDRSFNHKVSLKSHCHSSHRSGCQVKTARKKERAREVAGNEDGCSKEGTGSEFDNEEDVDEAMKTRTDMPRKARSTGRPKGRPKRSAGGSSVAALGGKAAVKSKHTAVEENRLK